MEKEEQREQFQRHDGIIRWGGNMRFGSVLHALASTAKYGNSIGLYRDDGLGILKGTPQQIERIKKDICKILKKNELKVTIEADKKNCKFPGRDARSGYGVLHAIHETRQRAPVCQRPIQSPTSRPGKHSGRSKQTAIRNFIR